MVSIAPYQKFPKIHRAALASILKSLTPPPPPRRQSLLDESGTFQIDWTIFSASPCASPCAEDISKAIPVDYSTPVNSSVGQVSCSSVSPPHWILGEDEFDLSHEVFQSPSAALALLKEENIEDEEPFVVTPIAPARPCGDRKSTCSRRHYTKARRRSSFRPPCGALQHEIIQEENICKL